MINFALWFKVGVKCVCGCTCVWVCVGAHVVTGVCCVVCADVREGVMHVCGWASMLLRK